MRLPGILSAIACSAVITAFSITPALAAPKATASPGYDVSYPQCSGAPLPSKPAFGIVGVSDGLAYGKNVCLATEYAWAAKAPKPAFYMNTGNPGSLATRASWYQPVNAPHPCDSSNEAGCAYDYGYNGAKQAYDYAASQTSAAAAASADWWLDVETANSWSTDFSLNVSDIQGSIDFFASVPTVGIGIYSTGYQWGQITGSAQMPSVLNWVAGASSASSAPGLCRAPFTGGRVALVQYPSGRFDADYAC